MKVRLAALGALLVSAQAPAPSAPPQPMEQQELQAMTQLCELAKYASRVNAEQPCAYFLQKYTVAAQRAAAEADAKKVADAAGAKPPGSAEPPMFHHPAVGATAAAPPIAPK